jgi:hypothetical protein
MGISFLCSFQALSQSGVNPNLKPYVDFLTNQKGSAKDYVLSLFENHDLVILCERAHPDITQYDLFLAIISDPRFINSVGNIFTEVGISTQSRQVNEFLHAENLPADSVDQIVLRFQRNCSFFPLWENYNYSYFLRGLYMLNQDLQSDKKINLFNSDVPFDWNTIDEAQLKEFWNQLPTRDSVIASQVIQRFDEISGSREARRKALVIMNYRHAFGHKFERTEGVKPQNVGRYLFERYGHRVANVYINFVALRDVRSDNDMGFAAIQDGKWDAAFKAVNIKDAGFNFINSPFGKDTFDIWPVKVNFTFQDVFDGFVFYLPLEEHKNVIGIPGFIDSSFAQEVVRRYALFSTLPGGRFKPLTDIDGLKNDFNVKRERHLFMLDSLSVQIDKWLRK